MILTDDMTSQIAGDLFLNPQNPRGDEEREGLKGKEKQTMTSKAR